MSILPSNRCVSSMSMHPLIGTTAYYLKSQDLLYLGFSSLSQLGSIHQLHSMHTHDVGIFKWLCYKLEAVIKLEAVHVLCNGMDCEQKQTISFPGFSYVCVLYKHEILHMSHISINYPHVFFVRIHKCW